MSYETQLLFYKETLKHRNKKKNMFLLQSCKIPCMACSRELARYTQLNYIPSCSEALLFLPYPFLPLCFIRGKGT